MGGIRSNANFIAGSVIAKDDKSLTIKLPDGGSKIIFYSVSTEIMKTATGTLEELKVGDIIQLERMFFARLDQKEGNKLLFWYLHK